jgi:hypothetical protein
MVSFVNRIPLFSPRIFPDPTGFAKRISGKKPHFEACPCVAFFPASG